MRERPRSGGHRGELRGVVGVLLRRGREGLRGLAGGVGSGRVTRHTNGRWASSLHARNGRSESRREQHRGGGEAPLRAPRERRDHVAWELVLKSISRVEGDLLAELRRRRHASERELRGGDHGGARVEAAVDLHRERERSLGGPSSRPQEPVQRRDDEHQRERPRSARRVARDDEGARTRERRAGERHLRGRFERATTRYRYDEPRQRSEGTQR